MSYGLEIYNEQGQLMFDTTKSLSSYVVRSHGIATEITLTQYDILFVKPVDGDITSNNDFRRYVIEPQTSSQASTQTFDFKFANPNQSVSKFSVSLDYFIIAPSWTVPNAGEDYGLTIYNEDGSIQFDARSATSDKHFQIINSYSYPDVGGNGNGTNVCNAASDGSSDEYLSVTHFASNSNFPSTWTYFDNSNYGSVTDDNYSYQIASFRTRSSQQSIAANEANISAEVQEGDSYPTIMQFYPRIESQILIGKLI